MRTVAVITSSDASMVTSINSVVYLSNSVSFAARQDQKRRKSRANIGRAILIGASDGIETAFCCCIQVTNDGAKGSQPISTRRLIRQGCHIQIYWVKKEVADMDAKKELIDQRDAVRMS